MHVHHPHTCRIAVLYPNELLPTRGAVALANGLDTLYVSPPFDRYARN